MPGRCWRAWPGATGWDTSCWIASTSPILAIGAIVATLGPTSQEAALRLLRPQAWLAIPAGAALAYLLLLVGGRLPNAFIYFQF